MCEAKKSKYHKLLRDYLKMPLGERLKLQSFYLLNGKKNVSCYKLNDYSNKTKILMTSIKKF